MFIRVFKPSLVREKVEMPLLQVKKLVGTFNDE